MKAMILAAGLGTRLRPLTDDRPKALVTVNGRTLLELTLARLRAFGVREVVVNAHHHADAIVEFLKANRNFGMRIEVSIEDVLLDTGGGLKKAAPFFLDGAEEAFLVHNVDVLSTIDLGRLMRFHLEQGALATLAVQDRETTRKLLFDGQGRLCGRRDGRAAKAEGGEPEAATRALAFSGIHAVSTRIFEKMTERGAFSIVDTYLRLAAEGEKILAFRTDGSYWRDLGRPESILEAEREMRDGSYTAA
jgi:NDP-sugar pyrophosphorylase family protein